jgi:DNA-binding FadR family transcriptional regulator
MSTPVWSDQLPPKARRRYLDVAEAIATAITSGELPPGERLPSDREIAQRFGVSRPTVREGLLALEYAGLIDVRQGSGAYVTERHTGPDAATGVDSPAQVIEARLALEPAIARLCATRLSPERARLLGSLVDRAELEVAPEGSPNDHVRLGLEFHRELANSCDNVFLSNFCSSLVSVNDHPLWLLLNRQAMLTVEARRRQVQEHRRILEAIVKRDPDAAMEAMQVHLKHVSITIVGGP